MTDASTSENYTIKISGPGVTIDKVVDLKTALAVMQVALGQNEPRGSDLPPIQREPRRTEEAPNKAAEGRQKTSIREHIDGVGGRSIPAKIVSIAHYIRDHEGIDDFTRDDIKVRFRSAGEVMPANFPRDFQIALQSGWIGEDPKTRGRFYITRRGDDAVASKFDGVVATPPRARKRRRVSALEAQTEDGDAS